MAIEETLAARAEEKCELCGNTEALTVYALPPDADASTDKNIWCCNTCSEQIEDVSQMDPHHWRCLNESMWSDVPAVQVAAWRMLSRLSHAEPWALELLETLYLDEETLAWAEAATGEIVKGNSVVHTDSNGVALAGGDTVTLIKDLVVKGAGFTAKRGTAVRGISLVADNADHIEGRVSGQRIVILTKFVKKS
ncbi:MAG: protein PhnA [Planctomycetota bacterium]|jgi:protein PhnA